MTDPMSEERLAAIERRFSERTMLTNDKRRIAELVAEVRRLQARVAELETDRNTLLALCQRIGAELHEGPLTSATCKELQSVEDWALGEARSDD